MTDEEKPAAEEVETMSAASENLSTFEVMDKTFSQLLNTANVNAVYSKPIRQGDTMVITAAETFSVMGFGVGEGTGQQGDQKGGGSGGGGGGQAFSRPVAVVVCTPNGVSIQPVMDRTKLWMAALTAAGFMLTTIARMRRPPRRR